MECVRNGVGADYGFGHVYKGDRYRCPVCKREVLRCNADPVHDPEHKLAVEYLRLRILVTEDGTEQARRQP